MFRKTTSLIALLAAGFLSGQVAAQTLTPLESITACNGEAREKGIEGDARRKFVTTCLRQHVRSKDKSTPHDIQASVERASKRLDGVRERIDAAVASRKWLKDQGHNPG